MVAIVGGNRLGLNLGSLASLGQRGVFGSPTQGRNGERALVNAATGDLVLQDLDASLVGIGPDSATLRTYNSQSGWGYNVDSGDGWQAAPRKYVRNQGSNTLRRYDTDGSACDYSWDPTRQLYVATYAPGSAVDTIRVDGNNNYVWTDGATGAQETYQGGGWGLITSSVDPSGNTVTYAYNNAGLLTQASTGSETVTYTYGGTGGRDLLQVTTTLQSGQVLSQVSYTYDGQDRLSTVTVNLDPSSSLPSGSEGGVSSYTTSYTYDGNSDRVTGITQSDGTSLAFTYVVTSDSSYRIATVTDGAGQVTSFSYDLTTNTTTVTDPLGVSTVYNYDGQGQLTQIRSGVTAGNAAGLAQLSYGYNALGDVSSITDGLGHTVTMQYDTNGNLTSQVDAAGDTLVRTYDARNQVLTETVYAAAAASKPQPTRYVYDAGGRNLLRFAVSPEGRVTEYRYDAHGLRTSVIQYPSGTYDTSALQRTDVPTEAQMAAWVGTQDLTLSERSDMLYDFRGQLKSVTTYGSVDATGAGVTGTGSTTQYVYDQRGLLLSTITPGVTSDQNGVTHWIYDGLGRVVSTVASSADGTLSTTTVTQYDDANGKTTVTLANGLATTSAYDRAGRLISVMQSSAATGTLGATRYVYDADGRLLMTEDPTLQRSWMLYDAAGRKVADVNAAGRLTEYVYNADNQVTEVIAYDTPVDTSKLVDANDNPTTAYNADPAAAPGGSPVTLASIRPAATAQDSRSWDLYDAAGRLAWQVDALGYVTQTQYDAASRVVSVTRLATPIDTRLLGDGNGVALAVGGFGTTTQLADVVAASGPNAPHVLTASVTSASPGTTPTGTVTFFAGQTCLGAAALVNGVASLTVSNLPVRVDAVQAVYGGDSGNLGSASNVVTDTVTAAYATTTALTAAPSSSAGSSLALTAAVTGQAPTGTVAFYDGGVPIGTATVVNGAAVLLVNSLPVGSNILTAVYLGDPNNATSTSQAITETITKASSGTVETVTTLLASNSQTAPGAPVTLTATVSGATPTGAVTFYAGSTVLGTAAVLNGVATLASVTTLPVGSDTLSAQYSGDSSNSASTSNTLAETVLSGSSVSLSASTSTSVLGSPVTLTARVSGAAPGGTVTFFNGATILGSATVSGGVASLTVQSLPVGSDGLTAVYSGDGANASSASAVVTETVQVAPTATTLTTASAQSAYGSALTLTATVAGTASPGGTVTFYSGATVLGTATLANGQATLTVSTLPVGKDSLTAVYAGDANNGGSSSGAVSEAVSATPTTTTLSSSATSTTQGATITLTARVGNANGSVPTGTVTFLYGTTVLGTATLLGGQATLSVASLPAGSDAVSAAYSGDATNATSMATLTETVSTAPTTVVLASSATTAALGAPVVLTARVSGPGSTLPGGMVTFYSGGTALGTATLADGLAAITVASLPVGAASLTATYAGDANNAGSTSATVAETITSAPAATTTSLSSSTGSVAQGTSFTLTANVTGSSPTGAVTFFNGQTALGTASVVNGVATLSTKIYTVGTATIVATYSGNAANATSVSGTVTVSVTSVSHPPSPPAPPPATTTGLSASPASAARGTPVTLTASVSGGTPGTPPTGTVSFFTGTTLVGSAVLANGTATLAVANLPVGADAITAVYSGDGTSATSKSPAVTETIALAASTTSLVTSATQITAGSPVTLVAQVGGVSAPGGTVTFYNGATALGTATLTNGLATLTVSSLAAGTASLTARYGGDANNATSTSPATAVVVATAPTTSSTTLSASTTSSTLGAPVTLTATVTGTTPGGTVTFFNGATLLGSATVSGGVATFTLQNLPLGSDGLKAVYSGDALNTTSASAVVTETVQVAPTTTSLAASSGQTAYGSGLTLTATVTGTASPGGTVTFYNGATALGSATLAGGKATLTVSNLPVGIDSLTAVYGGDASNGTSTSSAVTETVSTAVTTTTLTSSAGNIVQGTSVTLTAQVSGVNPTGTVTFFSGSTVLGAVAVTNGQATLTVANLPAGSDAICAAYSGDANNATSVAALTETVATAPTTVALTASPPSAAQGSPVILTARVTGTASTIPGGTITFYSGTTALGTATLIDGVGAITVTSLPAGNAFLTASYAGDANNSASTSAVVTDVVSAIPATTTTSLSSSSTSVVQGVNFTLTATVMGSSPTGVVTFFNGQAVLGTAAVVNGVATLVTEIIPTGTATVLATYSGDGANATSVSGSVSIRVSRASSPPAPPPTPPATTTTLTPASASTPRGTAVVLTATVSGGTAGTPPTGTVSFFNGTTLVGSAVVVNGAATLSLSNLAVGSYSFQAVYSGDATSATSSSSAVSDSVVLATSTTTLYASATQLTVNGTLTLVAQVAGDAPSGTVTFYSGTTAITSATVTNGLATVTLVATGASVSQMSAKYSGDANNAASTSAATTVTVTAAPTTSTTLLYGSTANSTYGSPVTLTAYVGQLVNNTLYNDGATGTVTFFDGSTALGSAALVNGAATLTVSNLPVGSDGLKAVYSGDANNTSSASGVGVETVTVAATTTVLTTSSAQTAYGSQVTITAAVSGPGNPGGTVTFYNGSTALGTGTLVNGQATLTVSNLPVGTDGLTAVYAGDPSNGTSTSAAVNETVVTAPTSLAVTSSGSIARNGVLSVQVNGIAPTGTVTFFSGTTVLGTARVVNGMATLVGADLPVGAVTLSATYSGDGNNASAVLQFTQTVAPVATVTTLTAGLKDYVAQNVPLVLTARISGSDPTGTVTFYAGGTAIGTATLANGIGAITVSSLPAGADALTAVYSGDANNAASTSAAVSEQVVAAPVYVTLTSGATSVARGGSLTLTATVIGNQPTGQVSFVSGTTVLGSATLTNGVATLTVSQLDLPVGSDPIVAVYAGDANNATTLSGAVTETVTAGVGTVTVGRGPADRTATRIYDEDGLLRATIDGEGYLTEIRYDAAGRAVETIAYATKVAGYTDAASIAGAVAAARASDSLAGLLPSTSPDDIRSFAYYDARGQRIAAVDGEGHLTETLYTPAGQVERVVRYANPVKTAATVTSSVADLRPASDPEDQVTVNTWDALGRLTTQTNAEGTVTQYAYNSVGQVIQASTALGTSDQRTVMTRYDVQGRVTAELSPQGAALVSGAPSDQVDAIWRQYATAYTYDAAGRRTSSTDANGNRTVYFYDAVGRLRFAVNAIGEVTENTYDALGHQTAATRYATRLSAGTTAALNGGVISSPANQTAAAALAAAKAADAADDSTTSFRYDADGRLVAATDAEQGVTTSTYDAFGDVVGTAQEIDATHTLVDTATFDRRGLETSAIGDAGDATHVNARTHAEYDAFGRLTKSYDANGNQPTQLSYDHLGRVVQVVDPTNASRFTTYDAFGRVLTQRDGRQNVAAYSYDTQDRKVTVTTPEGVTMTTVHNREGQTQSVTDGDGNTTTYEYDADGNLRFTRTPLADGTVVSTENQYDAADLLKKTITWNGSTDEHEVGYDYDAANRVLTRTVDPHGLNLATHYEYDPKGQQFRVTDPSGLVTETHYDLKGEVLTQTVDPAPSVPDGKVHLALTTKYTYDARGRELSVLTPGQSLTKYAYDALGRRTQTIVDPDGLNLVTSYAYDQNGNVSSSAVDLGGGKPPSVTRYVYDGDNRVTATIDGEGGVTETTYDANGNVTERRVYATRLTSTQLAAWQPGTLPPVAPDGDHDLRTRTVYDGMNRAIFTIDGTGAVVKMTYDGDGNVVDRIAYASTVDPTTAATADALAKAIQPDATRDAHLRRIYDALGRLTWSVDGLGGVTRQVFDASGDLTKEIAYANAIDPTRLAVDPATHQIDPAAITSQLVASGADRVSVRAYDRANRLRYDVDAMGGVQEQVYDRDGRVVQHVVYGTRIPAWSVGVAAPTEAQLAKSLSDAGALTGDRRVNRAVYDAAGRLVFGIDAAGAVTRSWYDGNGNAIATTAYARAIDASTLQPTATVDDVVGDLAAAGNGAALAATAVTISGAPGHETAQVGAGDRTTLRVYDAANRLSYVVDPAGYVKHSTYDGAGRVTSTTLYAKSVTGLGLGLGASADDVKGAVASVDAAALNQTDAFGYDAVGNLVSSTDALKQTESYTYDGVGDRRTVTNKSQATWTYDYDAAGRQISETSPQVALTSVSQDANGNLVAGATVQAAVVTKLTYDGLGNVTTRTEAAGRPEERTTQYLYDALGRQVQTIYPSVGVYVPESAAALTADDATKLTARSETTSKVLSSTTAYDVFGDAVAGVDVAGNTSYKAYDALGRVSYEVDALGNVTGYGRDAYGEATTITRYAAAPVLSASVKTPPSAAQISQALNGNDADGKPLDHSADRTITTDYDALGRAWRVTQPTVWVDDGSGSGYLAAAVVENTYDAFGQLVQTSALADARTNLKATTTHYFDRRGQETATVDAMGYVTTREYDAAGNLVQQTEYANATSSGSPSSLTLPTQRDPTFGPDRTIQYGYDLLNRRTSDTRVGAEYSTGHDGNSTTGDLTTTYGYDAVGNQTQTTDALTGTTYVYYDALGRTTAVAAPAQKATVDGVEQTITPLTVFARDAYGNVVVKTVLARGAASADGSGHFAPTSTPGEDRTTLAAYDSHGDATETTDANGSSQFMSYDAQGHLAKQWRGATGNDGVTHILFTAFQYDALGRQTVAITPASTSVLAGGTITTISQAQAGAVTVATTYDAFGEVTGRSSSGEGTTSDVTTFDYDNAGRLWRTNSGDGNAKVMLYDLLGRATSVITSAGSAGTAGKGVDLGDRTAVTSAAQVDGMDATTLRRSDSQLDLLGRTVKQTLPSRQDPAPAAAALGNGDVPGSMATAYRPFVNQTFDRWGNVLTQSDVRNPSWITTFRYNANNQVVERTQPDGNGAISDASPVTRTYYDALGRQVAVRDANGNVNGLEWNAAGQLSKEYHADGGTVAHAYDAFGDQVQATDADLNVTTYGYDKLGRNTSITSDMVGVYTSNEQYQVTPQGDAKLTTQIVYDQAGRRIQEIDPAQKKTQYTFDQRGNVVATTQPMGQASRAAFNANGREIASLDADNSLATWAYDGFGELTAHTDIGGAVYSYTYDHARQLTAQTNDRGQNLAYTFDAAGQTVRIDEFVEQTANGPVWQTTRYAYNAAGQHVLEQAVQAGTSYQDQWLAYDTLGRLAQVGTPDGVSVHFDYDKVGNRTHQATTYVTEQQRLVTPQPTTGKWYVDDGTGNLVVAATQPSGMGVNNGDQITLGDDVNGYTTYTWEWDPAPAPYTVYDQTSHTEDLWYAYDSMNRQVMVDGAVQGTAADVTQALQDMASNKASAFLNAAVTSTQGHLVTYDAAGNRASDTSWGTELAPPVTPTTGGWYYDVTDPDSGTKTTVEAQPGDPQPSGTGTEGETQTITSPDGTSSVTYTWHFDPPADQDQTRSGPVTQYYDYDKLNRLSTVSTAAYDENFNELGPSQATVLDTRRYDAVSRLVQTGPAGSLSSAYLKSMPGTTDAEGAQNRVTVYDANGRVVRQMVTKADGSADYELVDKKTINWTTTYRAQTTDFNGNPVFDAAGNPVYYQVQYNSDGTVARDSSGNPVPVLDASGNKVTYEVAYNSDHTVQRDASGNPVPVLDNNGNPIYPPPTTDFNGNPVYDAAGNPVYYQVQYNSDGTVALDASGNPVPVLDASGHKVTYEVVYNSDYTVQTDASGNPVPVLDANGNKVYPSVVVNHSETVSGFDDAGNLTGYSITQSGVTSTYVFQEDKFEGYKEGTIIGRRSDNGDHPGSTTETYDANGLLLRVTDATQGANDRSFVNDASGHVLYKEQEGNRLRELVVNGEVLAVYGVGANPRDPKNSDGNPNYITQGNFDLNYQPILNTFGEVTTGQYTVRSGDTLQGIAQVEYGDSSLWYLIAQANGLSGNQDLAVGQTLNVPARPGGTHNTAETFKPYDPSYVVGDTTPNLPVPQSSGGGCGVLGIILAIVIVVVAVVVTVITAGAASETLPVAGEAAADVAAADVAAAGAVEAGADVAVAEGTVDAAVAEGGSELAAAGAEAGADVGAGAGAEATAEASSTLGNLWSAGQAALQGGNPLAAAIGGAAGSAASQGLGNLFGLQHGFSWSQMAMGAIGAFAGAEVGGFVSDGLDINLSELHGPVAWGGYAAQAAASNAMTQGIANLVGLQDSFSWRNMIGAAVGAGVGAAVGEGVQGVVKDAMKGLQIDPAKVGDLGKFGISLLSGSIAGFAGGVVTAAIDNRGRIDVGRIATDAFGNALGQSIVGSMSPSRPENEEPAPASNGGPTLADRYSLLSGPPDPADRYSLLSPDELKLKLDLSTPAVENTATENANAVDPGVGESDAPTTVRAGDYGGSLERIARNQLGPSATQEEITNYVGQLFEINGISNARTIQPDQEIVLPGASTPAATEGRQAYFSDIAAGQNPMIAVSSAGNVTVLQAPEGPVVLLGDEEQKLMPGDFTPRAPNPAWVPSPNAPPLTNQYGFFFNERPVLDFGVLKGFLDTTVSQTQAVAQYYDIHPAAIPLAVYNEGKYNTSGWLSDYGQYTAYLATGNLPGQGLGFGSMHTSDVNYLYPDWTTSQTVTGRMNYEYAAPLIAADMDLKASIYEQITGGAISIRNDPTMLTWAYNTSVQNVIDSAYNAAGSIANGAQNVQFDIYQNKHLGGMGMAWYTQQNLPQFQAFTPLVPLPNSPVPYTFPARPPAP